MGLSLFLSRKSPSLAIRGENKHRVCVPYLATQIPRSHKLQAAHFDTYSVVRKVSQDKSISTQTLGKLNQPKLHRTPDSKHRKETETPCCL